MIDYVDYVVFVSIHAPAEGATQRRAASPADTRSFNPRSRGGSDPLRDKPDYITDDVSIHAPAEGATTLLSLFRELDAVSIHAPAEGATVKKGRLITFDGVSIHAPAEGATCPVFN